MTGLELPPFVILFAGAILLPLLPKSWQAAASLVFSALALAGVWMLPTGTTLSIPFYGYELILCQADALNRVFGLVFALIGLIGMIYGWNMRDRAERPAAMLYGGGALGVTFAGDFFTLLLFWEVMAVASTYLIWARRTPESTRAGMRYLLVHLFGGSLLLAGIVLHLGGGGSLALTAFAPGSGLASWLILAGVALNAAIPPLHAWLADAYPKSTVTGAIFLSALTTKSAVYVLARLFPGWEVLIYLGVVMVCVGSIYGLLANDIRQILAYSTISQVGYMVTGVGLGTAMALNGVIAHAFCHILYKALLFMGAGVVLETTGRSKLTELGGFARHMPWVVTLYMIGAFSISGFPLFNGFISKSIIVSAAGEAHVYAAKFLLILASAGTFLHTGLKLPYFTWFGPDRGVRPTKPTPPHMLIAMGILAVLCTTFGIYPQLLYQWLPHPMTYQPYNLPHLVEAAQVLTFTFIGFWILRGPMAGKPMIALDTDWFYRRPAAWARRVFVGSTNAAFDACENYMCRVTTWVCTLARNPLEAWQRRALPQRPFDPNEDRFPAGVSLGLVLLLAITIALLGLLT